MVWGSSGGVSCDCFGMFTEIFCFGMNWEIGRERKICWREGECEEGD